MCAPVLACDTSNGASGKRGQALQIAVLVQCLDLDTLDGIEGVNRNVPALCPVACDNPDVGGTGGGYALRRVMQLVRCCHMLVVVVCAKGAQRLAHSGQRTYDDDRRGQRQAMLIMILIRRYLRFVVCVDWPNGLLRYVKSYYL